MRKARYHFLKKWYLVFLFFLTVNAEKDLKKKSDHFFCIYRNDPDAGEQSVYV